MEGRKTFLASVPKTPSVILSTVLELMPKMVLVSARLMIWILRMTAIFQLLILQIIHFTEKTFMIPERVIYMWLFLVPMMV
jgi:serine kinase of HPr protein (carbohydrate metabolism regulator)